MEKLYYTIGEVAEKFNVNSSLIRFWEKEFDMIKPHRNKKGNRLFTKQDLLYFHQIYNMVKEQGYTLQGAKEKLKGKPIEEDQVRLQTIETLQTVKIFLTELKKNL